MTTDGPATRSILDDLAPESAQQTDRPFPYKNPLEAEYAAMLRGFGLPKESPAAIARWAFGAWRDPLFDDGKPLSRLIGRLATSLSVAITEALKAVAG